jgi:hypothetical protein
MADIRTIDQLGEKEVQARLEMEQATADLAQGVGAAPGTERVTARGIAAQAGIDTMRGVAPSLNTLLGLDRSSLGYQLPPPPPGLESRVSRGPLLFQGAGTVSSGEVAVAAINQVLSQVTGGKVEASPLANGINERDAVMESLGRNVAGYRLQIEGLRP